MARTRSLQNLLADVRAVADIEGATQRHTDQQLTRLLNQSIQAFRLLISQAGQPYYLTTTTGTMVAGTATISLPNDFVAVFGLDVQVGGEYRELTEFSMSERNKYESTGATMPSGIPTMFRTMSDTITLIPTPSGNLAYKLWYLPTGTDLTGTFSGAGALTASTSSFDGIAGWEDWIVYDTAIRVATRDAGVNDNIEILSAELGRIESRIMSASRRRSRVGTTHRKDTRGRRSAVESANRWGVR